MELGKNRARSSDWHISGWKAIMLAPIAIPLGIVLAFLGTGKNTKRTPAEVAGFIKDFIDGSGGEWDWDDFTSVPIADAELDAIRHEADIIALPVTTEGRERLKILLARAEKLKSAWIDAGQPE